MKLYVRRVFIIDDAEELMPRYLRFVKGVVDSEDLQLNVSREMLQHGATWRDARRRWSSACSTSWLPRRRPSPPPRAEETRRSTQLHEFWAEFGAVLKEGLYEDVDNRERLVELLRFRSTHGHRLDQPRRLQAA